MNQYLDRTGRVHIITIIATMYMLMAFAWWSLLLFRKNEENQQAKVEILKLQMIAEGNYLDEADFKNTPQYESLNVKHDKQKYMIWGEGSALFIGLLWGVWAINASFKKEMALTNQRRNFLLSITHELKSPIASIQLVLQTFQKRKLDEKQAETLLNSANKETDRLNELVNNLLLSAKLENAYEPVIEEINVSNLLDDILSKLKLRFPKVEFYFDKKEVPILRGDKQGLISVFTNLLENAVKYSQNHTVIHLKSLYENDNFIFDVVDNGLGIPPNEKKKVFEKFYRVGSEETRKTKGTGLGLFIVNQIVKAHKGTIQILDNEPNGSVFHVVFPNR